MTGELQSGGASRAVLLTLVPNSAIQFVDFTMAVEDVAHTRRRFLEDASDGTEPSLHVAANDGGIFYHPLTNEACDPARTYMIGGVDAVAPFLGQWLPVPFMRVSATGDGDALRLEEGPSNWTRVHISLTDAGPQQHYRVVLAIDTAVAEAIPASTARGYVAPDLSDLASGAAFRFSDAVDDVAWFVSEAWVDDWIKAAYDAAGAGDNGSTLQHLARYLTLLGVLREACELPALRFLPPGAVGAYAQTIPVDLALDLGTSRSIAVIGERNSGSATLPPGGTPSAMRVLALRNLSEPWRQSAGAFSSCVAFSKPSFGSEALSRWSGRTDAFHWPIPLRTGPEADALVVGDVGEDAFIGLSSPMHYVWDERPSREVWRFAQKFAQKFAQQAAADVARRSPVVAGTVLAHIDEAGNLIEERSAAGGTTKPRFSRSSLVTLQVAEILLHAIARINAPAPNAEIPGRAVIARRLERVVLTPPPGMGDAECAILRRRAEAAVKLVWQTMGWSREAHPLAPPPPVVMLTADASTATQIAYLENEIAFKFGGRADALFALIGRGRPGFGGARALRMATLDIGGSTTGLSVATYEPVPGNGLAVVRQLVDGFETGTTAVIEAIATRLIVPTLAERLADCKHGAPAKFLAAILGSNERSRPAWVGDLGRRVCADLLEPAGAAILRLYANAEIDPGDSPSEISIATLLGSVDADARVVADRLDVAAADDGADGFSPLEVTVSFTMRQIDRIARDVLNPVIDGAVRVLAALDCDIVLLSGSGAMLPAVRDAMMSGMPLRPDRIVVLREHRFGAWLPDATGSSASPDVKIMPAVGALMLARGAIGNGGPEIVMRPPERALSLGYIGCLGADGRIAAEDVVFDLASDLPSSRRGDSASKGNDVGRSRSISLTLPAAIGYRLPSLTSWPARPMWMIDRAPDAGGRPPKMPLKVVLEVRPAERGRAPVLSVVSAIDGDGGRLHPEELVVRLQSRSFAVGHWLDTGHLLAASMGTHA